MSTRFVLLLALAVVSIARAATQSENSSFVEQISSKVVQAVMPELANVEKTLPTETIRPEPPSQLTP